MENIHLLIIDPQNDFCHKKGALFVPGANKDMNQLARTIAKVGSQINNITVTLDTHSAINVAHPLFWESNDGVCPKPFTTISAKDVEDGVWVPFDRSDRQRMLEYTKTLEVNGRYPLCIWEPHCLIGSEGHAVVPNLFSALLCWQEGKHTSVNYVLKGLNKYTEHYGAFAAEVPDPADLTTLPNVALVNTLKEADTILISGEAGSHCVAQTVLQLATLINDPEKVKRFVFLKDTVSPVPGFEHLQQKFLDEMVAVGMTITTTTKFFYF